MKKEKLLRSMDLVDEAYVEEASPENAKRDPKKKWRKFGMIAACICILLTAFNLWMFLPYNTNPPDVSAYSDSEYYSLIQKLNVITYRKPRYKNNFDRLTSSTLKFAVMEDEMNGSAEADGADPGESYQEVTDNQVAGVIEGDRIKRSDKYIYYLYDSTLRVYSIEGADSKEVGAYTFSSQENTNYYYHEWEFYLSADCKIITVVAPYYDEERSVCVRLISLDVSDPANITEEKTVSITGGYLSSRLVNGKILLLTQFYVRSNDFSDEENFLPQIDCGNGMESIPAANIISPETLNNSRYTVVCKLDENTLEVEDSSAFLSYSQEVYVSNENVYATRSYTDEIRNEDLVTNTSMTEISCLSYTGDTFTQKGSLIIAGYINDQYSLDEYEGLLRVVTTTSFSQYRELYRNAETGEMFTVSSEGLTSGTSASLYCIDLNTWQIAAEVKNFAPEGEVVQSVRFDGTNAYVCTSIQLTDPVFFFDLSDINNITYKDTGTIEGFSSSLVNFGNGHLLGIGVGSDWNTLKIEIYEESETGVVSVCKYELPNTSYSTEYKSYYIDRNNQLVGMGIDSYYSDAYFTGQQHQYLLLFFDGYNLVELVKVPLAGDYENKRAVYIDGYLYMFGQDEFKVEQIFQK